MTLEKHEGGETSSNPQALSNFASGVAHVRSVFAAAYEEYKSGRQRQIALRKERFEKDERRKGYVVYSDMSFSRLCRELDINPYNVHEDLLDMAILEHLERNTRGEKVMTFEDLEKLREARGER